jgi:hypothetical protein
MAAPKPRPYAPVQRATCPPVRDRSHPHIGIVRHQRDCADTQTQAACASAVTFLGLIRFVGHPPKGSQRRKGLTIQRPALWPPSTWWISPVTNGAFSR